MNDIEPPRCHRCACCVNTDVYMIEEGYIKCPYCGCFTIYEDLIEDKLYKKDMDKFR